MQYRTTNTPLDSGLLVVPMFQTEAMDTQLSHLPEDVQGVINTAIEREDVTGKPLAQTYLASDTHRILVIGLGAEKDFNIRRWKQAVGVAVVTASKKKISTITYVVPGEVVSVFDMSTLGEATATAAEVANYAYDAFLSGDAVPHRVEQIGLMGADDAEALQAALERGAKIGMSVNFTRELGNTPPSVMTPALLAERAMELAPQHDNLTVRVLEREDMQELGMGCLLGVAQGSELPPKFIIIEFMNGGEEQPTMLVGKGITFDSGGLSLKPANFMTDMKFDMLGAGTALGIMHAAVSLDLKKNIVLLVPTAENMPSGSSFRPDDILTAMNGKTVEIGNTDAEGRLILADALSYAAAKYDPALVIDFATLTGACVVAVGTERSAVFTKDDAVAADLLSVAEEQGEWIWRLPLGEEFTEAMKSEVADISNISDSRYGGASTAAAFLEFFTLDHESGEPAYNWVHFDLASAYKGKKGKAWQRGGATGNVVQTVLAYLRNA